jgi:hypothetical protein
MVGRPASRLAVRCVVSRSGRAICENLQPSSPTAIAGATSVTARLPPQRSESRRWRHDIHRRFEVSAANGSRPIAGGPLRGGQSVRTLSHWRMDSPSKQSSQRNVRSSSSVRLAAISTRSHRTVLRGRDETGRIEADATGFDRNLDDDGQTALQTLES